MEKKHILHILSVKAIDAETFDLPPRQNAIIVCAKTDNEFIRKCFPENSLFLDFPDTQDASYPGAFCHWDAKKIINFVCSLSDDVTDIYICCEKGESRSPAVAAALLHMSGRSDAAVWCNPYYTPNKLVYLTLCREMGFFTNKLSVWFRSLKNRRAFKAAQKGKPVTYERWQILD